MSARQLDSTAIQARAAKIRCRFLDIDGVMSDCKPYLTTDGEEIKAFNARDGWGMRNGIEVADRTFAAQGLG